MPRHCVFKLSRKLMFLFLLVGCLSWADPAVSRETARSVSVAYCRDCFPFQFTNDAKDPDGIIVDYWKIWSGKTNVSVSFIPAAWSETIEMVRDGRADLHAGLGYTRERAAFLEYGGAIYNTETHAFFHNDVYSSRAIEGITAFRIGVLAGDKAEAYLKGKYPDAAVVGFETYGALMAALNNGSIKVFAGDKPTALHHLEKNGLAPDFIYTADQPLYRSTWRAAAGRGPDAAALMARVDKGMGDLPGPALAALEEKWFPYSADRFFKKRADSLELTVAEEKWLKAHPRIRIATMDAWPPMNYLDGWGTPAGIGADYIQALNERLGDILQITPDSFTKNLDKVRAGATDALMDVTPKPDRAEYLDFTRPYLTIPHVIVARKKGPYHSSETDLSGKTLALEKGFGNVNYFRKNYPDVIIQEYPDTSTALGAVARGRADAYAGNRAVAGWIMEKEIMFNLEIQGRLQKKGSVLTIGVRKDWPELAVILDKALASIPMEQTASIHHKWMRLDRSEETAGIQLAPGEKAWLDKHPRIRIAAMDAWPPMDFVDASGKPVGIGADFVRSLNRLFGHTVLEITPGPFKDNLDKVKARELDALLDVTPKPDRETYLNFTPPYMVVPHVIVARKDGPYFETEMELSGKILALETGFFSVQYFRENFPDVTVEEYPDTARALDAVARGQADAYAGNRAVASWVMGQEIMSNLEIQGRLDRKGSVLAIGIRKDWPELAAILEKALEAIPVEELVSIRSKWTGLDSVEQVSQVQLTPEEKAWIAERKNPVVVGAETDWPPYDFVKDGIATGYSNDLVRLAAQKTGLSLEFLTDLTWSQLLEKFEKKEVDVLPAVYKTPEREKNMAFTTYYATNPSVLVISENEKDIRSFDDLSKRKLAVPKGFSITEYLLESRPDIVLLPVSNVLDGLKAVSLKKADAFVGSLGVISYFLKENMIPGLRIIDEVVLEKDDAIKLHVAVNKDRTVLHGIVQKGLNSVTETERNELRMKWLGSATVKVQKERLKLTAGERSWLKQAEPVRMAVDPGWLPIERINPQTGAYEGIAADYIRLISTLTGVRFKLVQTADWSESVALAREGDVDMLAACSKTLEREAFMDFSLPYLRLSNAVIVKNNTPFLNDIGELTGKRVAVNEGTSIHRYLKENYPELNLVPNQGSLNGLKMVSSGKADAYVDTLEVVGYLINTHGLFDLKVALRLPKNRELHIALGKGTDPRLLAILNKGIEAVTPAEKSGFYRRWISLHVEEKIDYSLLWKVGLPVAGVLLLIFGIISFWNRKLANEILVRRKVEAELSDALNVITGSIRYASRIQRSVLPPDDAMARILTDYFVLWKPRDVVGGDIYWGDQWGSGSFVLLGDCTGHGVPGAFMTLISTGALDRALLEVEAGDAGALIRRMHQIIQTALGQTTMHRAEGGSDDGLELGVCYLPPDGGTLTFSGAGFPLFIARDGKIKMVKGERKGIGYRAVPFDTVWSNHEIPVKRGTTFYMSSDGIFDQVGGPKRMGFGKKRFKKLLARIQDIPMAEQGDAISKELTTYQGKEKRRDDISAIGFRM